jgi:hypothetical protein
MDYRGWFDTKCPQRFVTEGIVPYFICETTSAYTGSPGRTRTYNQPVNSRPLCQLSYRGMLNILYTP